MVKQITLFRPSCFVLIQEGAKTKHKEKAQRGFAPKQVEKPKQLSYYLSVTKI